ncbi:MAG: hypothetical protein J6T08_03240, partial [Lentisphaeria bacterium]|nr:hypothetical protein [Lentisphaeria bacterium]
RQRQQQEKSGDNQDDFFRHGNNSLSRLKYFMQPVLNIVTKQKKSNSFCSFILKMRFRCYIMDRTISPGEGTVCHFLH